MTDELAENVDTNLCKQAWYADDSSSAGELEEMRKWWDILNISGPKYGYFPLAKKTILIVKPEHLEKAKRVFSDTNVTITTEGERHMGAVIGSHDFKEQYVTNKINKWVNDIEELTIIAKEEPQAVYSCYVKAVSHRWNYVQRTIPNIEHLFAPLEDAIREKLIPALVGRRVSDVERRILALPVRMGGMGIANPSLSCQHEHNASLLVTKNLVEIIFRQERDFTNYNKDEVKKCIDAVKAQKEIRLKEEFSQIMDRVDVKMKRNLELAQETGSGAWLSVRPMQSCGYTLNKQEFRDSLCLRYGWNIPNTPSFCQCGKENSIDHTLSCKKGGYVIMRHNNVRDLEAELMSEVCYNVQTEPELLPIDESHYLNRSTTETGERSRPDVCGVGVHGTHEKTFVDIVITHPNCPSNINKTTEQIYRTKERAKKYKYNERILQIEKASFVPIVDQHLEAGEMKLTYTIKELLLSLPTKRMNLMRMSSII